MRFLGKNYYRMDKPDPQAGHNGEFMENLMKREEANAAASQRAIQKAKADNAKRKRAEDKAVAAMLAADNVDFAEMKLEV